MVNIVGKLLGSEKVIEFAEKKTDKAFFTKQEKAESWINTLKAYEPFKIAQRLIGFSVTIVYLFVWLISAMLMVFSYWVPALMEISKLLAEHNNNNLGLPFTLIVGLYFSGGAVEGVMNRFRNNKTGDK